MRRDDLVRDRALSLVLVEELEQWDAVDP
jgi:hypothetical protein